MIEKLKRSSLFKGVLCIISSAFFFALMNVFVRMSGDLPSYEKSMFRNLVAFLIAGSILLIRKENFHVPKKNWKDLLFRSVLGTIGILANYYAVDHLILADASAIQKLIPFITVIFSFLLLKEPIRPYQILCIAGAFASSLLIIRPGFATDQLFASLVAVIGAVGAGMAYVFVRKLSLSGMNRNKIIFYFSGFSMLMMLPLTLADFHPISLWQFMILVLAGIMAALGQFSVTYAYSFAPANSISIFDYSQIVFAAVFGFFFFGQIPDELSVLGYILIIGFALLNYVLFIRNRKRSEK